MYKLSNYTDYRQLFVLIITITFNLIILLINKLSDDNSLYLLIICIGVSLLLNLINSVLYDVSIVEKKILVKSLYKKQVAIEADEFCEIQKANRFYFFVFYTSPPFYILKLKNGKKYMFLSNSIKSYFSIFSFGKTSYANKLTEVVREKLS
jgi:hypothetical protein